MATLVLLAGSTGDMMHFGNKPVPFLMVYVQTYTAGDAAIKAAVCYTRGTTMLKRLLPSATGVCGIRPDQAHRPIHHPRV